MHRFHALEEQIDSAREVAARINAINERAWQIRRRETDFARRLSEEAGRLSTSGAFRIRPHAIGWAYSLANQAWVNLASGNPTQALQQAVDALHLADGSDDDALICRCLQVYSTVQHHLCNCVDALEAASRRLEMETKRGSKGGEASSLEFLALISCDLGAIEDAERYVERSLSLAQTIGDTEQEALSYNNYCRLYLVAKRYEEAVEYGLRGLFHCQRTDLPEFVPSLHSKLGAAYLEMGRLVEAADHLTRATGRLELCTSNDRIYILQRWGSYHLAIDDDDNAEKYLHAALELAISSANRVDESESHELLGQFYEKIGDYAAALTHVKDAARLREQLTTARLQSQRRALEIVHRTEIAQRSVAIHQHRESELAQVRQDHARLEVDLVLAKEAADTATRAKSRFLAGMSHELFTPLNAIMGYAQLLSRDPALGSKQRAESNVIYQNADHLRMLVQDVLDLSRLETGELTLRDANTSLRTLVHGIVQFTSTAALNKHISLLLEIDEAVPPVICIDAKRLQQVLIKLLENAIESTETGFVWLHVQPSDDNPPGDVHLRFSVRDTGSGIADRDLERIFSPFEQAGNSRYHKAGTGLGLALCRRLVAVMGGALQVTSLVGAGSHFWFELPLTPGPVDRSDPMPAHAETETLPDGSGTTTQPVQTDAAPDQRPEQMPDRAVLAELAALARVGDMNQIEQRCNELEAADPSLSLFAARARQLINDLDEQRLAALLS